MAYGCGVWSTSQAALCTQQSREDLAADGSREGGGVAVAAETMDFSKNGFLGFVGIVRAYIHIFWQVF